MLFLNMTRCLHSHNVQKNMTQHNIVISDVQIFSIERFKHVLIHVSHVAAFGFVRCNKYDLVRT